MLKSCSKCGKIHPYSYKCTAGINPRPAKAPDQRLRSTNRWKMKAIEIKERSKWLCALCLQEGVYNYNDLEVHHITKLKDDADGLLDDYNLICLCKRHHERADAGLENPEKLRDLAREREDAGYPPYTAKSQ